MPPREVSFIKACILSLASNINQIDCLDKAENWLKSFGTLTLSTINTNVDNHISKNSTNTEFDQLIYFNQVVHLEFEQPIDYFDWVRLTKEFEQQQDRHQYQKPRVTLDIDIIAVQLAEKIGLTAELVDEKGASFLRLGNSTSCWLGISRRFPLACYDQTGIEDLSHIIDMAFIREMC